MKSIQFPLIAVFLLMGLGLAAQQNVGIGTTTPDPSAALDVQSTDKGMLVPRMTTAQRTAIASPANGLLVFDITTGGFWYFNGAVWTPIVSTTYTAGAGIGIAGNSISALDASPTNELQTISISGTVLSLSNGGGSVNLPSGPGSSDNWGVQTVATTPVLSGNGTVANPLTIAQNGAASGQALVWNGANWAPSAVGGSYTAGTGIGIAGNVITNIGDANPNDDLTTASTAGGDVTGSFSNLQIAGGAVGNDEIANGGVTNEKIASEAATNGQVLTANGSGGTAWATPTGGSSNKIQDADGNTMVQVEESPDEDIIRFDLGGTESMVLRKNSNGIARIELFNPNQTTIVGEEAGLNENPDGGAIGNTFIGYQSGKANTIGESNTFLGSQSGKNNIEGRNNTAIGTGSLFENTEGSFNTAIGYISLLSNTSGEQNTAIGTTSLLENTEGNYNTGIGAKALSSNTIGEENTAIGRSSLISNQTGNGNTAIGSSALSGNTTGNRNTAIGVAALSFNSLGSNLVAVGDSALHKNIDGFENTAIGSKSLGSNLSGISNTAVGTGSLGSNTFGSRNSAFGVGSLRSNTWGDHNSAFGFEALFNNTVGDRNIAIGSSSLHSNIGGSSNIGIGVKSLRSNTIGEENTAIGDVALAENTTGTGNTAMGNNALLSNTTGNNNTAHGYQADVTADNLTNATAIGYNAKVGASNSLVLGGTGADAVNVAIGTATPAATLDIRSATPSILVGTTVGGEGALYFGNSNHGVKRNWVSGNDVALFTTSADIYLSSLSGASDAFMVLKNNGKVGMGRTPATNKLEVEGEASKSTAGDWLANSDARLKKNIAPLNSQLMLQNLLALRGITYEWDDDKTGSARPEGIQYGFVAQNIQEVFPTLVQEDKLGYLQTAYGTYDAMTVEAIRALNDKIAAQQSEIENLQSQLTEMDELKQRMARLEAAISGTAQK